MKLLLPFLLISFITSAQTPINEARKMRSGRLVTVNGTVTAVFGNLFFIQDSSGGIAAYGTHATLSDSVSVTGKLSKFNGMLEVIVDSIEDFGFKRIIQPQVIGSRNIADHEGELIQLKRISFDKPGHFFYPQRAGFITQENDTLQYWIDEDTDIAGYTIPGTTNITSVVGRFGSKLQLIPRSHSDIPLSITHYSPDIHHFSVVNWNVAFFGAPRYGPSNDTLQVFNVAQVIKNSQPDIVALQEVSNDIAFRSLIDKLPSYNGLCSSRYSFSFDTSGDFPPQKVCFLYKTNTVKIIRQKILFRKLFDEHPSDMFSSGRLPYLLDVEVSGQRLMLINIHAKSGAGENDWSRRLSDSRLLKDSLDTFTSPLILLGDFNDNLNRSIVVKHESPYKAFVNDNRYSCISKPLGEDGWHSTLSYDDVIDHQLITSDLKERHVSTKILNPFYIPHYSKTTSDHLPVISEFDFNTIISGISDNERISVYPNPTHDNIWFPPNSNITIMNTLGDVIIKKQGAHPPISLSEYAPGLYFVVLEEVLFKIIKN